MAEDIDAHRGKWYTTLDGGGIALTDATIDRKPERSPISTASEFALAANDICCEAMSGMELKICFQPEHVCSTTWSVWRSCNQRTKCTLMIAKHRRTIVGRSSNDDGLATSFFGGIYIGTVIRTSLYGRWKFNTRVSIDMSEFDHCTIQRLKELDLSRPSGAVQYTIAVMAYIAHLRGLHLTVGNTELEVSTSTCLQELLAGSEAAFAIAQQCIPEFRDPR
jgi:hypothetical protein